MAVPFTPDGSPFDSPIHQLLQIEQLLKELLTLLRWTGWTAVHGFPPSFGNAIMGRPPMIGHNAARINVPGIEERYFNEVLEAAIYFQSRNLPDVVASSRRPRNGNGNGNAMPRIGNAMARDGNAMPRIGNAMARDGGNGNAMARDGGNGNAMAGDGGNGTSRDDARTAAAAPRPQNRAVTLQVELCSDCYYDGNERKLKVIGVTRIERKTADGVPVVEEEADADLMRSLHHACRSADASTVDHHHRHHAGRQQQQNGATSHIQARGLKAIKSLASVIHRDSLETSLLTAIFVIVGWKMLIKK